MHAQKYVLAAFVTDVKWLITVVITDLQRRETLGPVRKKSDDFCFKQIIQRLKFAKSGFQRRGTAQMKAIGEKPRRRHAGKNLRSQKKI